MTVTMKRAVLILLGLTCLARAHAYNLQKIHETPGAVAAETLIQGGQEIHSLEELVSALGLNPDVWSLEVESSRFISHDLTRHRLRLRFEGVKVRAFTLQASLNGEGVYTGAVSGYIPNLSSFTLSGCSEVSQKQIREALTQFVNDQNVRINQGDIKAKDLDHFSYERQIYVDFNTGFPQLAYYAQARVNIVNYIRNPKALFDAGLDLIRGRVGVRNADSSCPNALGGNEQFLGLAYGAEHGKVCLHTHVKGDQCILRSKRVIVKDVENSMDRRQAKVVSFDCSEGLNDESNGAYSPNADAFYYGNIFFDILENWGKQSPVGLKPVTLYTHYGYWPNSFWDGVTATFGDSDDSSFPYVLREVVGHELCHAVTESSGNVVFDGESAGIDEAFADICGKAVSVYENPVFNWKFVDNLLRGDRDALRYFNEPTKDGRTIDNVNDFHTVEQNHPALGVGVFDKFFYLTVESGVPFRSAFECMIHANQIYWHEDSGFFDAACGVFRAAKDLGFPTDKFANAFSAVGIDLAFCSPAGCA